MVVKIDNNAAAVPNHSGLNVADIVFEEIVEGRTTRFAAVFHCKSSDPVGPIRSGRTQDINLFRSFNHPLFVWSGGNAGVTRRSTSRRSSTWARTTPPATTAARVARRTTCTTAPTAIWSQTPADQPGPPPQQFLYLDDGEDVRRRRRSTGVDVSVGSDERSSGRGTPRPASSTVRSGYARTTTSSPVGSAPRTSS